MKLSELYISLTNDERKRLAGLAGVDPGYLWQIATRWRRKRPSLAVLARLLKADDRLGALELISEFSD